MSQARRMAVRLLAGLAGFVALTLVVCLDQVDYQPYFKTDYYTNTVAQFRAVAKGTPIVTGELQAGFGRALLTPTLNVTADAPEQGRFRSLPLAGYGARKGRPATGVHDDVYVKAAALRVQQQTVVLISADALIIPREVAALAVARLGQELQLRREQIYLSATHTHASLGGWGEGWVGEAFAGGYQPGVRVWLADRMVAAAREALSDLRPAAMGQGGFAAPESIRNRTVGQHGRVDSEFAWVVVRQAGGRMGIIGSYGAHATVLSSRNMEFSADYPGAWQRHVEKATGGIAIFMAGGVGSHAPVAGADGFKGTELMGARLAEAVLARTEAAALTNRVALGLVGLDVALPPENVRLTDGLRLRPWLARQVLPVNRRTFMQGLRLQDTVWVSTPCDFSGELVLTLKNEFDRRGLRVEVTSFNGDYIGYVISSRYYHLDGYEPRLMSFFGPNVPEYLSDLIGRIVEVLGGPVGATF
ncbi:MAG: neutral/alkaline non-lysosomal ceramidase N-terminal domain-containing protein [Verrucomicrobiota bacterium]